jgi:hypothetical protein
MLRLPGLCGAIGKAMQYTFPTADIGQVPRKIERWVRGLTFVDSNIPVCLIPDLAIGAASLPRNVGGRRPVTQNFR